MPDNIDTPVQGEPVATNTDTITPPVVPVPPAAAQSTTVITEPVEDVSKNGKAVKGMVLGIIAMIAWIIPIVGLPIAAIGLFYSIKGMKSIKRSNAITGIVLCSIGLVATIVNGSIGAYLGVTGQHPIINKFSNSNNDALEYESPEQKKQIIADAVAEVKKKMPLPYVADEYTMLTNVTAEQDAIRYAYSIAGLPDEAAKTITSDFIKANLVNGLCSEKDTRYMLNSDINMEYVYNLKDYSRDVSAVVSKSDCK